MRKPENPDAGMKMEEMPTTRFPFIRCSRPASYWDVVCRHLPLALVTGIPLITAVTAGSLHLSFRPCTFRSLTGYPCPFCGFTRSFIAMAAGDWWAAFSNCPLGCGVFALCVLIFVWNLTGLLTGLTIDGLSSIKRPGQGKYLVVFASLLLGLNWGYRLLTGLQ
jgi:hypothetical protein